MAFIDSYKTRRGLPDKYSDRDVLMEALKENENGGNRLLATDIPSAILHGIRGNTRRELIASIKDHLLSIEMGMPIAEIEGVSEEFLQDFDLLRPESEELRLKVLLILLGVPTSDDDPDPPARREGLPQRELIDDEDDGAGYLMAA